MLEDDKEFKSKSIVTQRKKSVDETVREFIEDKK